MKYVVPCPLIIAPYPDLGICLRSKGIEPYIYSIEARVHQSPRRVIVKKVGIGIKHNIGQTFALGVCYHVENRGGPPLQYKSFSEENHPYPDMLVGLSDLVNYLREKLPGHYAFRPRHFLMDTHRAQKVAVTDTVDKHDLGEIACILKPPLLNLLCKDFFTHPS